MFEKKSIAFKDNQNYLFRAGDGSEFILPELTNHAFQEAKSAVSVTNFLSIAVFPNHDISDIYS